MSTSVNKASLTPLNALRVSQYQIPRHGRIPNTSIQHKPLLVYHSAFVPDTHLTAVAVEAHIASVGLYSAQWQYTMYAKNHFHSTTHELLVVFRGSARVCFGGEDNPGRVELDVSKGDAMLVPAGVAHRLLEQGEDGFEMVGSYPVGATWDLCYGTEGRNVEAHIAALGWLNKDPLYGDDGPALHV
ncbi:hypothetical protein EUX98_g3334 [Antrodiella citrinella]|uniref:Cupin type-2 domain-containing protein n=1 Tax=Antrodiella citrinella TaxID=2447956 RepID=A0A4S4MWU7_9APHY|nr:hypothetical protein EUX98_g3334 [Antrodiella citrinella]